MSCSIIDPDIDLRKIRVISYNGQNKLYYGSVPIVRVKEINKGGNSVVYKCTYMYYNKEKHFAFRMNIDGEEDELLEIEKNPIKKKLVACNKSLVPFRIVKDQSGVPYMVMQLVSGDVYDIVEVLTYKEKIVVIKKITKGLECFYNEGLVYTDLKLENILYKKVKNKTCIFIGDLDSFFIKGSNYSTVTYPSLETLTNKEKATKGLLLYTIGIFIADIFLINTDIMAHRQIRNKKKFIRNYNEFKQDVLKSRVPEKIKFLILRLTNINLNIRNKIKFDEIYGL